MGRYGRNEGESLGELVSRIAGRRIYGCVSTLPYGKNLKNEN